MTFEDYCIKKRIYDKYHIADYMTDENCQVIKGEIDWSWVCRDNFYIDAFDLKDIWEYKDKEQKKLKKLFTDQGGCIKSAMSLINEIESLKKENEKYKKN